LPGETLIPVKHCTQKETIPESDTMTGGTIHHHLSTLSNLFRRAQAERRGPAGHNPIAGMLGKPTTRRAEAQCLEVLDAALLLKAARTYRSPAAQLAPPFLHALLATYLLTGGRRLEVLGLEVSDVSFDRRTVTFRPNRWRRLKTETSHRTVSLWPQLEDLLRAYLCQRTAEEVLHNRPTHALLFPAWGDAGEALVTDFRKVLDRAAARVGWPKGEIRARMVRHTYCAARLQTLKRGRPSASSPLAASSATGGRAREADLRAPRGNAAAWEVLEYRIEQHHEQLRERLERLAGPTEKPAL
jgi:integrase